MTFDEMAAQRDPLYAATKPDTDFRVLKRLDTLSYTGHNAKSRRWYRVRRNQLTREIQRFCALRNQGEPYYHKEAPAN